MGQRLGAFKVYVGTDVAANTEWLETVPAGKWWHIRAISVTLVQGAVQTPRPTVLLTDGTNDLAQCFGASDDQNINTTCHYTWGSNLALTPHVDVTTNVHANGPLPSIPLPPGGTVGSYTVGLGANSNYGAPVISVVEFDTMPLFDTVF